MKIVTRVTLDLQKFTHTDYLKHMESFALGMGELYYKRAEEQTVLVGKQLAFLDYANQRSKLFIHHEKERWQYFQQK